MDDSSVGVCAPTAPGEPSPRYARLRGDPRRLGVVAVSNSLTYPPLGGYDAEDYLAYARDLVERGELPDAVGAYYTPPGYMALAGVATKLGARLGLDDPEHLGQLLNAIFVVAAGVLVYLLARVLWPARPVLWFAAVGFFAFFPTVLKTGAMFHPEPLSMLLTAGALVVLAQHGPHQALHVATGGAAGHPPRSGTAGACVVAVDGGRRRRSAARRRGDRSLATPEGAACARRRRRARRARSFPLVRVSGDAVFESGVRSAAAG